MTKRVLFQSHIDNYDEYATLDEPLYGGEYKGRFDRKQERTNVNNSSEYELENNLLPICCEVILDEKDIPNFIKDTTCTLHTDINYPKFSMGFNHWIHATKNKTEVFNTFKNKKKIYQVVNGYERYIDDYDKSIGNVSEEYFKNKPRILSRAYYKLWELLFYYDLIDVNNKSFLSAHLAEGPGSFIQATIYFREMFSKHYKQDKYYGITLHSEKLNVEEEFMKYYKDRLFVHKTYETNDSKTKDNGDITQKNTIINFTDFIGEKVNFITADGGFDWNNENIQEQESAVLIFGQIITALNIQKKGGSFVLKMFETFTDLSMKFIMILKYFYETVHINKPLTSRESNSERYIVCINFKFSDNTNVKYLLTILDTINKHSSKTKIFLHDIFTTIKVPSSLMVNIIAINTALSNSQFKIINKIIEFLNGSNFHGELYSNYKTRQITLATHWINTFMTDTLATSKQNIIKLMEKATTTQTKEYNNFAKHLIGYDAKQYTKTLARSKSKSTKKEPKARSKSPKKESKTKRKPPKKKTTKN